MTPSVDAAAVVYTARWIVPVDGPPLEHGRLTIRGGRIAAVEADHPNRSAEDDAVVDLGDAILCPGLVNAHTHLEFSDLANPLGAPGMSFPAWVRDILAYRAKATFDPVAATLAGLRESIGYGSTTLGDIASTVPSALFDELAAEPTLDDLDVTVFVELIGMNESRLASQTDRLDRFLASSDRPNVRRGVSPHAPYSVLPTLVARAAYRSSERRVPLALHLAESRDELQFLREGTGPFAEFLTERGAWGPDAKPFGTTPLDYLKILDGKSHRTLLIHGNYLVDRELDFLASRAGRMAVVYCPRTHAYFAHDEHPLPKLLAAGASVALGTDGRCTNPDLDLLTEMRTVARAFPQLAPERIVRLGTFDGARALGVEREVGSLSAGKQADFITVAAPTDEADPFAALLADESRVVGVWKRGRRVV